MLRCMNGGISYWHMMIGQNYRLYKYANWRQLLIIQITKLFSWDCDNNCEWTHASAVSSSVVHGSKFKIKSGLSIIGSWLYKTLSGWNGGYMKWRPRNWEVWETKLFSFYMHIEAEKFRLGLSVLSKRCLQFAYLYPCMKRDSITYCIYCLVNVHD